MIHHIFSRLTPAGNGTITKEQMFFLNLYWEFGDLVDVYGGYLPPYYESFDHCSALVRVLDNNTDILIAHVRLFFIECAITPIDENQASTTICFVLFSHTVASFFDLVPYFSSLVLQSSSQNTWTAFNMMMRIYKLYDFPLSLDGHDDHVAAERVSFSAYPGSLFSADDFYVLSSGMVVQETTIGKLPRVLAKPAGRDGTRITSSCFCRCRA